MAFQTVFKRYELKYLITPEQREIILLEAAPFMMPDKYGNTTIRNIYFDTDDDFLIRETFSKAEVKVRDYERIKSYVGVEQINRLLKEIVNFGKNRNRSKSNNHIE